MFINMLSFFISAPISGIKTESMPNIENIVNAGHGMAKASFSLIDLMMQASLIVQIVMLILLISSIWSWAIIFDKIRLFSTTKSQMTEFEKMFWSGSSIDLLFQRVQKNGERHPLANVLRATVVEWNMKAKDSEKSKANITHRLHGAMKIATSKSLNFLEHRLGFLATIGSVAPFVGLFGTVWGIMASFQSIAAAKNVSLAVVAPGIAEALLATAFGLIAAIPAVVFYNRFSSDINYVATHTDDFSAELSIIMMRDLENK